MSLDWRYLTIFRLKKDVNERAAYPQLLQDPFLVLHGEANKNISDFVSDVLDNSTEENQRVSNWFFFKKNMRHFLAYFFNLYIYRPWYSLYLRTHTYIKNISFIQFHSLKDWWILLFMSISMKRKTVKIN